jgi:hypothetical protein
MNQDLNPYLPENYQDYDQTAAGDEIYDLACEMFEVEEPTQEQLELAAKELDSMGELYEAKYL